MADADLGPGVPPVLKHYRLVRQLGSGGMGAVYEAADRRDESRVAIKLLHPHLALDENFRERFEREAHVAALLRSPYTVHLLDYGYAEGYFFLAMEFIDGESVAQLINREGRVDTKRALGIAADAARALEEASARGVVHRDIKPDNILLGAHGSVKVADFGVARRSGSGGDLETSQGFIGTTTYAAPEQGSGGEVDHRADIYALGATLYCMLTGQPPFHAETANELLRQHREATLPMAPLAGYPDAVINIVRRCMEKDPADRYETATQLVGALERAQRGLSSAGPAVVAATPTLAASPAAPVSGAMTSTGVEPAAAANVHETMVGGGDGTPPRPASAPGGGGSGRTRKVLMAGAGLGGLVVFGAAAIFALGGDDNGTASNSSTDREETREARTSTARAETREARTQEAKDEDTPVQPTAQPTAAASKTSGASSTVAVPPTATVRAATPTSTTASGYILSGEWTYAFTVVSNTCGSGAQVGEDYEVIITLDDANGDGFLDAGETVTITDTGQSGNVIGDYTFTYPQFVFQADLEGGDFVVFTNSYFSSNSGAALREDHYTVNGRPCVIAFEDRG